MNDSEQVVPFEQTSSSVPTHSDPQCIQALVLPCRKRKAAVLNYAEFMDVATKLSQASERKKATFGTLCCGMMLQLLDIANGQDASILDDELDHNLINAFPHLIDKYKSSFKPVKQNQFKSITNTDALSINRLDAASASLPNEHSVHRSVTVPSKPLGHQYATCNRIKPMVERVQQPKHQQKIDVTKAVKTNHLILRKAPGLKPKPKRILTCSFCGDRNHQKCNCPLKISYGPEQDGSRFVEYLLNQAPFSILDEREAKEIIYDNVSSRIGVKHIVVHSLHVKFQCNTQSRPRQDDLAARITFLDKIGKPYGGYTECLVDLIRVIEYIYKHNGTKGRCIFSFVNKKSIGSLYHSSQTKY